MRFDEMMDLAAHGPDTYIGRGPQYPWGGLYGGQIVAQSLRAAATTVDPDYQVHSLHAYFIRPGDAGESIRFEVDRLRNGRSFATRSVVARQEAAILHMAASFQRVRPESGAAAGPAAAMPDVPGPGATAEDGWSTMFSRRTVASDPGTVRAWMCVDGLPAGDPVLGACALAYTSDELPCDAHASLQRRNQPLEGAEWYGTSLDHAIWFQAPVATGWQFHDFRAEGSRLPRGLSLGRIFAEDGTHLATVSQELLLRRRSLGEGAEGC